MADALQSIREANKKYLTEARRAMSAATNQAAATLLAEMRGLTAAIGPTLNDLRAMDHPYATRHGAGSGPTDDWIAHTKSGEDGRTGELLAGLRRTAARRRGSSVEAEVHSDSDHTWFMLLGTPSMRPRDFVSAAIIYRAPDVDDLYQQAFRLLVENYQDGFKTEVTLIEHDHPASLPEG